MSTLKRYLYDYMCTFNYGDNNPISMTELAERLNVSKRTVRKLVNEINDEPTFEYRIKKGDPKGYYIIDKLDDIRHTRNQAYKKLLSAVADIKWANEELRTHGQVVWNDEDLEIKNKYKGELK